jgi:hypothetical protein
MNFDVKTHESLVLLAGLLILVEQEVVRLASSLFLAVPLEPNGTMSNAGVALVLASVGITGLRNIVKAKAKSGDDTK